MNETTTTAPAAKPPAPRKAKSANRYAELQAAKPMIECRDVHKFYADYHALRGINLDIREGEFFSLLGPSGCGKTTLLRTIAGFEDISSGVVLIDGKDMTDVPANKRRPIWSSSPMPSSRI